MSKKITFIYSKNSNITMVYGLSLVSNRSRKKNRVILSLAKKEIYAGTVSHYDSSIERLKHNVKTKYADELYDKILKEKPEAFYIFKSNADIKSEITLATIYALNRDTILKDLIGD